MPDRILIVDDEAFNLDLLEQELADRGYAVERARDGAEAVRKVESARRRPRAAGLLMPGMDGMAVLEAIRRSEPDVVVIVITGHGTIARAVEAMKKGAYDFVSKPVDAKHLEIVLGKALERQRASCANALLSSERATATPPSSATAR